MGEGENSVRLRVLGELAATRCGADVALGGRRQRAVLAVLVIARGEVVAPERLADCLWGDEPPANPAGTLQSYVSHLRRRLEPEAGARSRGGVIASAGRGYTLRLDDAAVDAWRFEHAVHAAAAMPPAEAVRVLGEALAEWHGPAYAEYAGEPWAEAEAARLTGLRAVARERLLEARLDLGEAALVVPELETLVAEDPLREERWRLLVIALYRAQRQADALAALRQAREALAEALGVDPGPELRALEQEVLAQSPTLDMPRAGTSATVVDRPSAPPGATAAPASPGGLVERDRELGVLTRAVDDLVAGAPGVVLVEGSAGIGKTRLLGEAVRMASAAGVPVLSARGTQLERTFAFGAVRQLFEPRLVDALRRDALFVGPAATARGVFEDVGEQPADRAFAVLHGLYWLTVHLAAETPLVLAVDDVQWCDPGSLRFLAYLVKRLEGLGVLVLMTLRTGEEYAEDSLLAELALDPTTVVLRPQPLSAEATTALVEEWLGTPAAPFVSACHRTTAGNPLLLRQLLRALEAEAIQPDVSHADTVRAVGSRAVSSLVLLRLRRMPADLTTAARAVAVLGQRADLPTVAALARLPEERAAAALDLLSRSEVLRDGRPLAFVHPLVRDAVYDDLPAAERALLHERAAGILVEHAAAAEEVAAHLLLSPRRGDGATVAVLRSAARTAVERGASDSAVALLRRALEEPATGPERIDVLVEVGLVEALVDGPAAAAHLCEAYDRLDDARRRAEVATVIARTHVFASPPGVATAFAREAAAALPDELHDARQGLVGLQRITGFMHGLPPATYRSEPRPVPSGDGVGACMLAATLAWEHLLDGQDRTRAVELAQAALEGDRLLAADNGLLWVVAANVLILADADLGDFWDRARRRSHAAGSLFAALSVNLWYGFSQWRRGALDDALESLCDAAEQHRMWRGSAVGAAYTAAFTVGVHLDRGDVPAARAVLDEACALPQVGEGTRMLQEAEARTLVEEGRPGQALATLDASVDALGIANPVWAPWRRLRAAALAALGSTDEAARLLEEEVALLRRWGAPSALGPSLRALGEVDGAAGALREAVDMLTGTDASLELARARLALARSGDIPDREARELLTAAVDAAGACGAGGLLRDAAAVLAERGVQAARPGATGVGLTARERRVLDLTAAGLDVNAVAQELFLTPGTVRALLQSASAHAGR